MSSQDIELGERWNENITQSLSETDYGLIFVTSDNIKAPWINFEAGALSKTLKSRVVPILFNTEVMILQEGPLKQFQSTKTIDKQNILRLVKEINDSQENYKLDSDRLNKAFEMWWPRLEDSLKSIEINSPQIKDEVVEDKELLSLIISKLNNQEKMLRNTVMDRQGNENEINALFDLPDILFFELQTVQEKLVNTIVSLNGIHDREDEFEEIVENLNRSVEGIHNVHNFLRRKSKRAR